MEVLRKLAHEFREHRDHGDGVEGKWGVVHMQAGRDIDIVGFGASGFWCLYLSRGKGWQWCIGAVKFVRAGIVNGNIDLDGFGEAWV
jgi:hypothetical protein